MSKSEYKRLAVQIPDVVKVIREQVLEEAIEAINKMESWTDKYEAMDVIENLKNK